MPGRPDVEEEEEEEVLQEEEEEERWGMFLRGRLVDNCLPACLPAF